MRGRTTEAVGFIRKMTLSRPGHAWRGLEAARDEWSAMEAVVHLELLLEAEGLLIEERTAHASSPGQDRFRAESYIAFPPLQDPETYNLVQVMEQVKKMGNRAVGK
jgi:hypothetical protein